MCRRIVTACFFVDVAYASVCSVIRSIPLRSRYRLFLFFAILTRTFGGSLWRHENTVQITTEKRQRGTRGGSSCVTCAFRVNFGKFLFVSVNLTPIRADQGRVHYLAQYPLSHHPHPIAMPLLWIRAPVSIFIHTYIVVTRILFCRENLVEKH